MVQEVAARWSARVDEAGRVLIPAALRRQCGQEPGTAVALSPGAAGELRVQSRGAAVREAQAYFKGLRRGGKLCSDELIADRHREARREYGG